MVIAQTGYIGAPALYISLASCPQPWEEKHLCRVNQGSIPFVSSWTSSRGGFYISGRLREFARDPKTRARDTPLCNGVDGGITINIDPGGSMLKRITKEKELCWIDQRYSNPWIDWPRRRLNHKKKQGTIVTVRSTDLTVEALWLGELGLAGAWKRRELVNSLRQADVQSQMNA